MVENCRDLMKRTVKVQMINKYSKVFLAEICFSAVEYLDQVRSFSLTENFSDAMSLCRRKYFLGLGQITVPLPMKHDKEHKV